MNLKQQILISLILVLATGCHSNSTKKTIGRANVIGTSTSIKKFNDYEKEADTSYNKYSTQEDYLKDCQNETIHKIIFPLQTPAYAIVHLNDDSVGKFKLLTTQQLHTIINILNDTSTYRWGEIDTPYFDKYITFYNRLGRCIAITNISYDGQTESTPSIAKMKNGLLTDKGEPRLKPF